jgi:ribosomal subunit interface protein
MLFDIKATRIQLTDGILTAVENKLMTLDSKVARFGESVRGRVEVCRLTNHHKKGDVFHCAVSIALPGKKVLAESEHADLYVAINDARKEAERQIVGFKGKKVASVTRGARLAKRNARAVPGEVAKKGGRTLEEGV